MFPVGIINVCGEMIPCGKRFIEGMLSGGFATLNRPAKFGFFLSEKLGMRGGRPSRRPYSYAGMVRTDEGRAEARLLGQKEVRGEVSVFSFRISVVILGDML